MSKRRCACDLIDWLSERGIAATVSEPICGKMRVWVRRACDVAAVPLVWRGNRVTAHTGEPGLIDEDQG